MKRAALVASAMLLAACGTVDANDAQRSDDVTGNLPATGAEATARPDRAPVETSPPNARGQQPAFAGQTRAPAAEATEVEVTAVVDGLASAWALEFLPDGRMLVTEKAGTMRILPAGGGRGIEVTGVPEVDARGQGGLLDVALSPGFAEDRLIYFSFSEPREGGNGTTLARARLSEQGGTVALENVEILFRQMPTWRSTKHYGSRIVFTPDDKLFLVLGERSDPRPRVQAQQLDSHLGKVIRLNLDGTVPDDNPFVGRDDARPEIWSYGHRNLQSATLDGQGRLWTVEHGPRGGDELNRPEPGKNYGWPVITYGIDYSGKPIGEGITAREGMEQPVYYWDPVIAPSGMAYYDADLFPEWRGNMLIGGLASQGLVRLILDGDRVTGEERIDLGHRIRDVKVGPDGAVYAVTDRSGGQILRVAPSRS
ncbi:MAG TPA: PQQ-dependent sugar dehydrogenase [Geminicoccus sp.]|uniref:PQQ-dependent sugar dehydrogenase n=1 Tax=Geminicoccus sp. TaxID=2024832 RepID=UPI002CC1FC2B|nr:PQQ-dependent sugar dehydrogenase [Geminicoccus sp.]HWL67152.1 PQQ-dependent sugar dehydrogenase [Geminicoccus sp.]